MLETLQMAGPLRSADITPLHRYYGPSRHPLVFGRLPGFAGYTAYLAPAISRWDEEGLSSCSACPCHRAVASTPPRWPAVSVSVRLVMLPSPLRGRLGPRGYSLSRPQRVYFCYGPVTRSLPKEDFVDRLRRFCFHHLRYPNYGALTSTPAGLSPAEHASLRWTHHATCGFPALRSPICFMSRLMRPILLGRLSALPTPSFPAEALSLLSIRTYRPRNARTVQPSP